MDKKALKRLEEIEEQEKRNKLIGNMVCPECGGNLETKIYSSDRRVNSSIGKEIFTTEYVDRCKDCGKDYNFQERVFVYNYSRHY